MCDPGCYMPHLCDGTAAACLMQPKRYYPLFADLAGRRCLVVGGGLVAQRKVITLCSYGAQVAVVSPRLTRRLLRLARTGQIRHLARRFRPADLAGAWLAYAATDDPSINSQVYRTALRRRVFTNVVDQTPLCTFIAPAIVRQGALTAAVSTGGASPSLAKLVRDDVRQILSRYAPMAELLRALRGVAKRDLPEYGDRKRYFDRLVRGRALELMRAGHPGAARRKALALLKQSARAKR